MLQSKGETSAHVNVLAEVSQTFPVPEAGGGDKGVEG